MIKKKKNGQVAAAAASQFSAPLEPRASHGRAEYQELLGIYALVSLHCLQTAYFKNFLKYGQKGIEGNGVQR